MGVSQVDPSNSRALKRFVAVERLPWDQEPMYWSELDADLIKRFRGKSAYNRPPLSYSFTRNLLQPDEERHADDPADTAVPALVRAIVAEGPVG